MSYLLQGVGAFNPLEMVQQGVTKAVTAFNQATGASVPLPPGGANSEGAVVLPGSQNQQTQPMPTGPVVQPSFLDDLAMQTGLPVPALVAVAAVAGYLVYTEVQKKKKGKA